MMDKKAKNKRAISSDSFLETLRDLGQSSAKSFKRDLIEEIPHDAAEMIFRPRKFSGDLKPNESVSFEDREKEIRDFYEKRLRQQDIVHHQEIEVFSARKQEEKARIEALQAEVIELAKTVDQFNQEVKVAAIQQTVTPGVYHEAFFTKLISFIKSLRQKVDEATTWLGAVNKKSRKQPYYWTQFKSSGTKFMLSQERYMATQAG